MKKVVRPILWAIFALYCLILIYVLFLSRGVRTHYPYAQYFQQFTNFIPFKTIVEYIQRYQNGFRNISILNLLGNFVLFLPMGIFCTCLFPKLDRFWKVVLCVLGMVFLVEVAQGLLRVGSIDIDDVIFNLGGAMLGYGIFKLPLIHCFLVKVGAVRNEGGQSE